MKTVVTGVVLSMLLWAPVFAEQPEKEQEKPKAEAAQVAAPATTSTQTSSMPPGLKKQGKTPPGLKKKGKTPAGWSHGKKTGWKNSPSQMSHAGGAHGHR